MKKLFLFTLLLTSLLSIAVAQAQEPYWVGSSQFFRAHLNTAVNFPHQFDYANTGDQGIYAFDFVVSPEGEAVPGVVAVLIYANHTGEQPYLMKVQPGTSGVDPDAVGLLTSQLYLSADTTACFGDSTACTWAGYTANGSINNALASTDKVVIYGGTNKGTVELTVSLIFDSALEPEPATIPPGKTAADYPYFIAGYTDFAGVHDEDTGTARPQRGIVNFLDVANPSFGVAVMIEHSSSCLVTWMTEESPATPYVNFGINNAADNTYTQCAGASGICKGTPIDEFANHTVLPVDVALDSDPWLNGDPFKIAGYNGCEDQPFTGRLTVIADSYMPQTPYAGIGWTRPLNSNDEQELANLPTLTNQDGSSVQGFIDSWSNETTVYTTTFAQKALVHSATPGEIYSIEPLNIDECGNPDPSEAYCTVFLNPANQHTVTADELANVSIVSIRTSDDLIIQYAVANAEQYSSDGAQVLEGCVLGETIEITQNKEIAFIHARELSDGTEVNVLPQLVYDPLEDNACGTADSGCYNLNADLDTLAGWQDNGEVKEGDGEVILKPGSSISQIFDDLFVDSTYAIGVVAQGKGELSIHLGDSEQVVQVDTSNSYDQTIQVQLMPAPEGVLHPLRIEALSSNTSDITVKYVCLSFELALNLPSACGFANPNFDNGLVGWDYLNPVDNAPSGGLFMGHQGSVSQSVDLFPNEDGSDTYYRLEIRVGTFNGETFPANEASITTSWDTSDGTNIASLMTYPDLSYAELDTSAALLVERVQVVNAARFDFTFSGWIDPEAAGNLKIERICLTPEDGSWDGYEDVDSSTGFGVCEAIQKPDASFWKEPVEWTIWGFTSLINWLECTLLTHLRTLMDWVAEIFSASYAFFKWMATVWNAFASWLADLTRWLAGHFANFVYLLVKLGAIVRAWALLAWNLFMLIVEFAKAIIGMMYEMILLAIDSNQTLVEAWQQATPKQPPGVQDCTTSPETKEFCMAIWAIDNTVLGDAEPSLVVIYLIIGIGCVHAVIWTLAEFRSLIVELGDNPV